MGCGSIIKDYVSDLVDLAVDDCVPCALRSKTFVFCNLEFFNKAMLHFAKVLRKPVAGQQDTATDLHYVY